MAATTDIERASALPFGVKPSVSGTAAAAYVGVSPGLFDVMVKDGRMPKPKLANTRTIWDTAAMLAAFDDLPTQGSDVNPWDEL